MAAHVKSHEEVKAKLLEMQDGNPKRKEEAKAALIRTGVLTKTGKKKKVIVSWE